MAIDQYVFVGLRGRVVALDRDTGAIAWACKEMKGSSYVTLLLDGERLIVSSGGYLYCLDPENGRIVWHNPLRGYGVGVAHLVSVRGQPTPVTAQAAQADAEAAAAAAHSGS
jgi:outer membrane protein assembly factor BamB